MNDLMCTRSEQHYNFLYTGAVYESGCAILSVDEPFGRFSSGALQNSLTTGSRTEVLF